MLSRAATILISSVIMLAGCTWSMARSVTGEIRDDAIVLATDHAGSNVRFSLQNVGSTPCHLAVLLAPMPPDQLPVENGQVAVDPSGAGPVRPPLGGDSAFFSWVRPGDRYELEIALEGAPKVEERVVLCNEPGDYQHGRYAVLRFDR